MIRISRIAATLTLACAGLAASEAGAQAQGTGAPRIVRTINRTQTIVQDSGRAVVRVDARPDIGLAIVDGPAFGEGTIELDVRGEDKPQQSFVGIAFAMQNDSTYEAVFVRPFNFRTPDTARAKRTVQYVSHPAWPWNRLRAESPGKYEKPIAPIPDPNGWVPLRLVITRTQVSVFANGGDAPDLVVTRLGDARPGAIAFWAGNSSRGDYANLRLTPTPQSK